MDYKSVILGNAAETSDQEDEHPLRRVIDSTLVDFLGNDLVFCLLEPLEIYKLDDAKYRVHVRSRLGEEESKSIGADFVAMIHKLFDDETVSISQSEYLYFGSSAESGEKHKIFEAEDEVQFSCPSAPLTDWLEAKTDPLRWSYAALDPAGPAEIQGKFERYRRAQVSDLLEKYFPATAHVEQGFLYNLLVPAAFQGKKEHSRSKRALGAVFLVVLSKRSIPDEVRERLFMRLSLCMYYFHSAEAIDKLIVESGMDRYRSILGMLESPLIQLTSALSEVERDAQELRAILFEPSRGLMAARHRLAEYFKEGLWIQTPDGGSFSVRHQPSDIRSLRDAQWTLAFLLSAIRGEKPKILSSKEALAFELVFFREGSKNPESPYHGLSNAVARFFPGGLEKWCSEGWAKVDDLSAITSVLSSFKENLFSVLKPDFDSSLTVSHVYMLLGIGKEPTARQGASCVVPKLSEPFSSFAHLVEFLGMLIEQHAGSRDHSGLDFVVEIEGCSCNGGKAKAKCKPQATISSELGSWIVVGESSRFKTYDELAGCLRLLISEKKARGSRDITQMGNFIGCFAYLFERCSEVEAVLTESDLLAIRWQRFEILFKDRKLMLRANEPDNL